MRDLTKEELEIVEYLKENEHTHIITRNHSSGPPRLKSGQEYRRERRKQLNKKKRR